MSNDDSTEEIQNRVAQRFDTDEAPDESSSEERSSGKIEQNRSEGAKIEQSAQKAKNVKKAWNATSVYLPDELDTKLSTVYKRVDLQLSEDAGRSIKKTRHYYPLVVALGLERLERMEGNEIIERMDELSV